jgi:hypothetical protein
MYLFERSTMPLSSTIQPSLEVEEYRPTTERIYLTNRLGLPLGDSFQTGFEGSVCAPQNDEFRERPVFQTALKLKANRDDARSVPGHCLIVAEYIDRCMIIFRSV